MKNLTIFFSFILASNILFSQWEIQSPYPTSQFLCDVSFVNESTGWSIGEDGTIIYTNDGGITWGNQESGTTNTLVSSSFVDSNNGWIVGGGSLLHTIDGGDNWMDQSISDTINWRSVEFKDQHNGWIAGKTSSGIGIVMHTSDAGNNWEIQLLEPTRHYNNICFTSITSGWIIGSEVILHTNDGGETWNEQYNTILSSSPTISFTDSLNGWASGGGAEKILHTADGGETWIPDTILGYSIGGILDICFLDILNGWILCHGDDADWRYLLYTSDGGVNWNACLEYNSGHAMCFINPETGWVVGRFGSIKHTSNGFDWDTQSLRTNNIMITDICFKDDQNGWALGNSKTSFLSCWLMETNNGGEDWVLGPNFYYNDWLKKIYIIDENNFWITGEMCNYQTKDGGANWEQHDEFGSSYTIDMFFTNIQHGWAVCWDYFNFETKVYSTFDGGDNWEEKISEEGVYLTSTYFIDQSTGWVVGSSGDSGVIINTINGGITWTNQLYKDNHLFKKVYFYDLNNGFVIGIHGSVIKTSDGGNNWIPINEGFDVDFSDVFVVDSNNLWAIGSKGQHPQPVFEGLIYYSSNGGQTWAEQESGTSQELLGIWFNDIDIGWIVGDPGIILHTENGGLGGFIDFNGNPPTFKVYPNPSSSTVTIELSKTSSKETFTSILNTNGQEVITQQIKDPKTTIDISSLSAGIYFVKVWNDKNVMVQKVIKQ